MKFKILLYLFLFVCIVLFYQIFNTNKILNHQDDLLQEQFQSIGQLKDSIQKMDVVAKIEAFFSLKGNRRIKGLFSDLEKQEKKIMRQLFESNSQGYLKFLISLPEGKFLIDQVKVINQEWVLIGFQSDQYWGQAVLEYTKKENTPFEFKLLKHTLNPL